jgi:cyclophilin family peptidyl-prolyl cis-trans isomerase
MRLFLTLAFASALTCLAQTPAPVELPAEPGLYAVFDTSMGRIVARLYEDKAPATVKSFVALANGTKATLDKKGALVRRHYYDGLTFHRVIKQFMIQTGDVNATGRGQDFASPDGNGRQTAGSGDRQESHYPAQTITPAVFSAKYYYHSIYSRKINPL